MPKTVRPVIGFIGTGTMGMPMCHNLLRVGHPLVVFNRTAARVAPLVTAGAQLSGSVGELSAASDIVICCLDSVAASEAVLLGDAGVVASARPGTILVEHSTISPALVSRVAIAARARSVGFLDAPVSGGPEGAAQGTLAIMVGGDEHTFASVSPILGAYGGTIRLLGPNGAGTNAKLVNQLLTFVHGAAAAEAIALAEASGLDVRAFSEVLRESFGYSRMFDRTSARVLGHDYSAGAALRLFAKDLGLVRELGGVTGIPLPVADAAQVILDAAIEGGFAEQDIAALRLRYPRGTAD